MTGRNTPDAGYRYWAFISYSHQDRQWSNRLHRALETYRVPRRLRGTPGRDGPVPARIFPVFRDRDELPSSADLGENINQALAESRCLVAICSPRAAASHWVNQEIATFKSLGRPDRVLCLIVDGEPNAADKPGLGLPECFPPAVKYHVQADGSLTGERTEPIAADVRPETDGWRRARLKIIAGILGVNFDDLARRGTAAAMVSRSAVRPFGHRAGVGVCPVVVPARNAQPHGGPARRARQHREPVLDRAGRPPAHQAGRRVLHALLHRAGSRSRNPRRARHPGGCP